jgi:hypothetical protein
MFELPKFTLIGSNPSKTIFNVSAVYGNIIEVEFAFFLGDPDPEVVRWDMRTSTRLNVTAGIEVVLSQEYLFRLQHSGNQPLGCLKQNSFLYTNCSSDVAEAYFVRKTPDLERAFLVPDALISISVLPNLDQLSSHAVYKWPHERTAAVSIHVGGRW